VQSRGSGAAVAASFLGWTLDAFDFFLVVLSVPAIAREFGRPIPAVALSLTLTLLTRPLGAIIFGLMADRYGRRLPLMIDLVFFSIVEVATGFAPTFTTFLVLRALFGIGMGGEWGVGATLAMEKAPSERRGIWSGLLQEGYATGYLLAAVCSFFVLPKWGWRPMFYIGGLPALLALFVRFRVSESEVWERTRHANWESLLDGLVSQWRLFLGLVLLMTTMNLVSHGTQDLFPTFLKNGRGFSPERTAVVTAFSMIGALAGGLWFGSLSDRIGRRKAMIGALIGAVLMIPLWIFAPSFPLIMTGAFLMQFMVQGAWGIIPAHLNELAPDGVRGFLPGFGYQCGAAIAGPIPFILAALAERTGYPIAMAGGALVVCSLAAIVVALGREKRGVRFG
jgi:SHS family lactate transporter-like MFS transporter